MTVSVLIPFTGGDPWRDRACEWVLEQFERMRFLADEVVLGASPPGPYSRTGAMLDAASRASGDVLIVHDADVWCSDLPAATSAVRQYGWATPHRWVRRLSPESTERVYDPYDDFEWADLALSTDNAQDSRPYRAHATGGIAVFTREVFEAVPPDPRFVGWGQEDDSWEMALRTLVGKGWHGTDDLIHLWHPPQERKNRRVGSREGMALHQRYRRANGNRARMAELVAEAKVAVSNPVV